MTLAKMDQRFQLISHHRDDKQTEPQRTLVNPAINSSKPNKVSTENIQYACRYIRFVRFMVVKHCKFDLDCFQLFRFGYKIFERCELKKEKTKCKH